MESEPTMIANIVKNGIIAYRNIPKGDVSELSILLKKGSATGNNIAYANNPRVNVTNAIINAIIVPPAAIFII